MIRTKGVLGTGLWRKAEKADATELTLEGALVILATADVLGVLVIGDVAEATLHTVLEACPASIKVGVFNAGEETVQTVARYPVSLRVGPCGKTEKPWLSVATEDARVIFADRVTTRRAKPRGFYGNYLGLVPFDGFSLETSLTKTTPARREFLDWYVRDGVTTTPIATSFARFQILPRARTRSLTVGAALLGSGLVLPGFGVPELIGATSLLLGLASHLELRTLRRKFGEDHA